MGAPVWHAPDLSPAVSLHRLDLATIDALARGALKAGMPKAMATRIAAQTVLGSARMILESDDAPWVLIDKVCSPGGTTIAGLMALEDGGFVSTVVDGVQATIDRDLELGAGS